MSWRDWVARINARVDAFFAPLANFLRAKR